jgi:hypothetical protein
VLRRQMNRPALQPTARVLLVEDAAPNPLERFHGDAHDAVAVAPGTGRQEVALSRVRRPTDHRSSKLSASWCYGCWREPQLGHRRIHGELIALSYRCRRPPCGGSYAAPVQSLAFARACGWAARGGQIEGDGAAARPHAQDACRLTASHLATRPGIGGVTLDPAGESVRARGKRRPGPAGTFSPGRGRSPEWVL